MRTGVCVRRRHRNPLLRRSDIVETWTALVVAVLLVVGAPLLGTVAAVRSDGHARAVAAEQRAERHRVGALVTGRASEAPASSEDGGRQSFRATVRWTARNGTTRDATARVPADTRAGDTVGIWVDSRDRRVPPPAGDTEILEHTVTVGAFTTLGTALVVVAGHRAVRGAAMRRRLAEWDRAWARTEPRWTHRRT
ncbi:hypothetical protein [Streptomyces sp. SID8352]|uniref:Rv1733c family protein n=1 Tax=Streptomyces sp. SID8352 TaxID=2690338 RepID=UPI00136BA452|nr:hypothetical protein [Streptomyces sp. SID8352]MYU24853.1 hypothetical protein [Streptomyces sp. SID8352]